MKERERERENNGVYPGLYLFFLLKGQATGGGASATQTQKREKKPKMTDAEVVAHLRKYASYYKNVIVTRMCSIWNMKLAH